MNSDLKVVVQGNRGALKLDMTFEAGVGVTALFGPSGSGKTSVLRAIAGLWEPDSGKISIGDKTMFEAGKTNMSPHLRGVGCVFQSPALFPHLSVQKNLSYGHREGSVVYDDVLRMLDLGTLQNRRPRHLSGGEAQRVALGRALLSQPNLLLLDEPLTGLDRSLREAILPYLEEIPNLLQVPIIYVSHSEAEIKRLAQRVIMVDSGGIIGNMSVKGFAEQQSV